MVELLIAEKPNASEKIAEALADTKPKKKFINKIAYYELEHKGKKILVGCAVGHLFGLEQKKKKGWTYPIFDVEWKPAYKSKKSAFSKPYFEALQELAKQADEFTVCTDYDEEGSVIGFNIIRYICNKKDGKRMKFSTLTKKELIESYENAAKHLDFPQIEAGEARHILDWYHGINLSRALTLAIKQTGTFKIMSAGRVQGPALKVIVDREKEIQAFKPEPFWELELEGKAKNKKILAQHKEGKFQDKKQADQVLKNTQGKKASVDEIKITEQIKEPPYPFDLTSLQMEAYKVFGISPKETLSLAQDLYTAGLISYPRTSSQKLPIAIQYKDIIKQLQKFPEYENLCSEVLKGKLKPNEGKKSDAAHPAIYPTAEVPKKQTERQHKLYDLIVKRFLATFGTPATRETVTVNLDVNKEIFVAKGTRTTVPGWHKLYEPYVKLKDEEMPKLEKGEEIKVDKIDLLEKETQPPKRYNQASIIKELEKKSLGTKCLTENTLVTIKSEKPKSIKISDLFNESLKTNIIHEGAEIGMNTYHGCLSLFNGKMIESKYKLISRRKLKSNEKVYELKLNDNSIIQGTQDHPILCWQKNSFIYKKLKELKQGERVVCSNSFINKVGSEVFSWEKFRNQATEKTKIYGVYDLNKHRKVSQYKLSKEFRVSQPSISEWEKNKQIPIWAFKYVGSKPGSLISISKQSLENPFPIKMSSQLARILANLVGDGSIDREKIKRENCFDFRYHNKNIVLINRFVQDIYEVFGIKLKVTPQPQKNGLFYVRIPALIGRIISVIAPEVLKKQLAKIISEEFYQEAIGALFDDEGHTVKDETKLFISNTNFKLLNQLKRCLKRLNIDSKLSKKQYKLYIYGKRNLALFLQKIPILSKTKKERLFNHLNNFYKFGTNQSQFLKDKKILLAFEGKKKTSNEIASMLKRNMPIITYTLRNLIKQGFVKKEVVGISERPRKKILYSLNKNLCDTYYSFIGEEFINAHLHTKTVRSNAQIDYGGYVYDITNNLAIPNFMLSNGAIVHNSTRASIVDALYERHYVNEKSIEATKLGMATVETLEKYCPEILDEALTRHFEQETDEIRDRTKKEAEVIKEAEVFLEKVLNKFKEHEKEIGEGLVKSVIETRAELNTVAPCKVCNKGNLELRRGRFGLFIACNQYPDCKTTFSVPSNALIKPTEGECPHCNSPMVLVIRKSRRPFKYCISKTCPPKVAWIEEQKKKKAEANKIQKELQELPQKKTKKVTKKKSKKTKE